MSLIFNMNPAEILDALKNYCTDPMAIDKLLPNWPQSLKDVDVELPNELLQIFKDAATVDPPPVLDVPCGHTIEGRTLFEEAMKDMWQHYFLDCSVKPNPSGNCEYTVRIKITWLISIDNAVAPENYVDFFMRCIETRFDADFNKNRCALGYKRVLVKDTDSSTTKKVVEKDVRIVVISSHCIDPGQESESEDETNCVGPQ